MNLIQISHSGNDSSLLQMLFAGVGKSEMAFILINLVPQLEWLQELGLNDWNG